jgi:hypothetical protein
LWLFSGRKVSALVDLVVMDQFGIHPLRPAPWSRIEFVREDAHGNRDGDAFGIEIPEFPPILPIKEGEDVGVRKQAAGGFDNPFAARMPSSQ